MSDDAELREVCVEAWKYRDPRACQRLRCLCQPIVESVLAGVPAHRHAELRPHLESGLTDRAGRKLYRTLSALHLDLREQLRLFLEAEVRRYLQQHLERGLVRLTGPAEIRWLWTRQRRNVRRLRAREVVRQRVERSLGLRFRGDPRGLRAGRRLLSLALDGLRPSLHCHHPGRLAGQDCQTARRTLACVLRLLTDAAQAGPHEILGAGAVHAS